MDNNRIIKVTEEIAVEQWRIEYLVVSARREEFTLSWLIQSLCLVISRSGATNRCKQYTTIRVWSNWNTVRSIEETESGSIIQSECVVEYSMSSSIASQYREDTVMSTMQFQCTRHIHES